MPVLKCGKREKMVQLMANGEKPSPAYRKAFKSKAKPESIHSISSRIMEEVEVQSRLVEVKAELACKALWTRENSVEALKEVAARALDAEKYSDVVGAVKALNSMHGWDKQTIDHTSSDGSMSPKEPRTLEDFYASDTKPES